jgi:D-xylose transport system permease protein
LAVRSSAITVLRQVVVWYPDQRRGVPVMFTLFVGPAVALDCALTWTRCGRSMTAAGGSQEAARRAGIDVAFTGSRAFVPCASPFGGRGSAFFAVLGAIVIRSMASGLTLSDLSSSLRFMITGAVLAIAVIVDSLARQSRVSHGRA